MCLCFFIAEVCVVVLLFVFVVCLFGPLLYGLCVCVVVCASCLSLFGLLLYVFVFLQC